jgi:membrane-associated phospholipid phosphatase
MATLAWIVSVSSGFALFGFRGRDLDLLATALVVGLVFAFLTASVAARRGRSRHAWFLVGLAGGVWAFAAALVLLPFADGRSTRGTAPPKPPPTPYAA